MNWVVKMNKNHGLQFKSYVNQLVVNLEDADPEVRNVAKTAIVQLYQCVDPPKMRSIVKMAAVQLTVPAYTESAR